MVICLVPLIFIWNVFSSAWLSKLSLSNLFLIILARIHLSCLFIRFFRLFYVQFGCSLLRVFCSIHDTILISCLGAKDSNVEGFSFLNL